MLKEYKIETLLVTNPDNIFYLSGFQLHDNAPGREAFLLISAHQNLFITDGRLIGHARESLDKKFFVVERNHDVSTIRIVKEFLKKHGLKKLGFEKNNLTVAELERFNAGLKEIKLVGTEGIIEKLRLKKNKVEINKIKKAAEITDWVFSTLIPFIKPGRTEMELVWKIKTLFNQSGAKEAFEPIIASGKGSAIPHYTSINKKLKKGELVLLDFGAKYMGYCSDMTRVIFLGKADTKTQNIYDIVLKAQKQAINQLSKKSRRSDQDVGGRDPDTIKSSGQKSISAKEIDRIARSYIIDSGFSSIPHGLGHGVGISIHEDPRLNPKNINTLSEGMVFTAEPGIYLKGWGGIRIEDLIHWGKNGVEILSNSPKELIEIL